MNWYKKSQFNSGFDKITLKMYKKLLNDLLEEESEVPEYVKREIPEEIIDDPEIQELLNAEVTVDNGNRRWYVDGKKHRVGGPAVEYAAEPVAGRKEWWQNGKKHREDGPAIENVDGGKAWYVDGKCHRLDGPAVEYADGGKEWYQHGKLHREDGPAVEYSGGKAWWIDGKKHRLDGPAVEYADGRKFWYLNGKGYEEEEFKEAINELV